MADQGEGGSIVHIASIEAQHPTPVHGHYATSKAGLVMHAKAAALAGGPHGIRVNSVSPGLIDRPGLAEDWPEGVERWMAAVRSGEWEPQKTLGTLACSCAPIWPGGSPAPIWWWTAASSPTPLVTGEDQMVRTVGLAGTGVIGSGWAVRVAGPGIRRVAWDPADGAEGRLRQAIERAWPAATELGLFPGADPRRVRWADTPEDMAASTDWIQESAPEEEELKRSLLRRLDAAAPPHTVIASSSSGLLPTGLAEGCRHPDRVLIGHPFNPVYLLPLVEVVAGEATGPDAVAAAVEHYDDLVMHPLIVRNEIEGYLSDRLQEALWREVLHLVNDGVATTAELDDAVVYGPGLRWAAMGTNLTFHLAGGDGGMRQMLSQFGPALKLPWTHMEAPELTDELIESMASGTEAQAAERTVADLERQRDQSLLGVMRALSDTGIGAGRLITERDARIQRAREAASQD